jgi:hypothetical protein
MIHLVKILRKGRRENHYCAIGINSFGVLTPHCFVGLVPIGIGIDSFVSRQKNEDVSSGLKLHKVVKVLLIPSVNYVTTNIACVMCAAWVMHTFVP